MTAGKGDRLQLVAELGVLHNDILRIKIDRAYGALLKRLCMPTAIR